jgi:hypothetical protein
VKLLPVVLWPARLWGGTLGRDQRDGEVVGQAGRSILGKAFLISHLRNMGRLLSVRLPVLCRGGGFGLQCFATVCQPFSAPSMLRAGNTSFRLIVKRRRLIVVFKFGAPPEERKAPRFLFEPLKNGFLRAPPRTAI